ncbi:unknown [Bacteroides sp. CAG:633]|nr:unknown [Bacteroides sp. CAG:633]
MMFNRPVVRQIEPAPAGIIVVGGGHQRIVGEREQPSVVKLAGLAKGYLGSSRNHWSQNKEQPQQQSNQPVFHDKENRLIVFNNAKI